MSTQLHPKAIEAVQNAQSHWQRVGPDLLAELKEWLNWYEQGGPDCCDGPAVSTRELIIKAERIEP